MADAIVVLNARSSTLKFRSGHLQVEKSGAKNHRLEQELDADAVRIGTGELPSL